jgi:ATP-dependent exoDNAse (exonuclease V) alpha subunit
MALNLRKLFGKAEPAELATLRNLHAKNMADLELVTVLSNRAADARKTRHESLVTFSRDLNVENAEAYIEADRILRDVPAWEEITRFASESLRDQLVERTREPLVAALRAVMDSLGEQMNKSLEAEQAAGAKLGVEIGAQESPVHRALTAKLNQVKDFFHIFSNKEAVEHGSYSKLENAITFVLND